MKIIRHIFSILFYIVAGVFIFQIGVLSFLNQSSWSEKFSSVDTSIIYVVLALVLGAVFLLFRGWAKATGITLLSATSFSILVIITIFYLSLLPKFHKAFPDNNFYDFSEYRTGCITMLILLSISIALIELGKSKN